MKPKYLLPAAVLTAAVAALSQQPPPAPRTTGPGIQAGSDSHYAEVVATCKTPPPGRGGAGAAKGGAPKGGGAPKAAPAPSLREYTISAISGVVDAGLQWKEVWTVDGNNADGFTADANGDLLIAQNDNSEVVKLDSTGKATVAFTGTNTGGSLAFNTKGALFILNRGLMPSVEQLLPKRQYLADRMPNGDTLDCIGTVVNDMTADSKGGVYFTAGTVFHVDPKGKVTRYGENLGTNGILLSADEKMLFVTNGGTLAAFDVKSDGSLANQREFAKWEGGGGDGLTFDAQGRIYVTFPGGIQVVDKTGKNLGMIPTPRAPITATFGGADRKTLYTVVRDNATNKDWILALPVLTPGAKPRAK
ncbi:MAG: SMP-30/gluconolactonase/LRE family protein [Bryobacteraceae bacterium]